MEDKKFVSFVDGHAPVIKKILLSERGEKCELCTYNKVPLLQVHHKKGRKCKDANDLCNLMLLCMNCHGEQHLVNGKLKKVNTESCVSQVETERLENV